MTVQKNTSNFSKSISIILAGLLLLIAILLGTSSKFSSFLLIVGAFVISPLSNRLLVNLSKSNQRLFKTLIPIFCTLFGVIVAFQTDADKEKGITLNFIVNNKENLLVKNMVMLDSSEKLYTDGKPLFKNVSNQLTLSKDSNKNVIVTYNPKFTFNYRDSLNGSYLFPIEKYGNLKDYDLIFYFDRKSNLNSIKAKLTFQNSAELFLDSNQVFDLIKYRNEKEITMQKAMNEANKNYEEGLASIQTKKKKFEDECMGSATGVMDLYIEIQTRLHDPNNFKMEECKYWIKEDHVLVFAIYSFTNVFGGKQFVKTRAKIDLEKCSIIEILD